MPWTKLSDDYSDDCWELSDAAYRLHTEGLNWSNRKLLDCLIPKHDIRLFAKHPEAVPELLAIGWWADRDAPTRSSTTCAISDPATTSWRNRSAAV